MKDSDINGADNASVNVYYQRCSVVGCKYKTKSRNLGKHMQRRHPEDEKYFRSSRVKDGSKHNEK